MLGSLLPILYFHVFLTTVHRCADFIATLPFCCIHFFLLMSCRLCKPENQFSFKNSTSQICCVTFSSLESSISFIDINSALTVSSCALIVHVNANSFYPFSNHGQLLLDNLSISRMILLHSLVQCDVSENPKVFDSLIWSHAELETIMGCNFKNITVTSAWRQEPSSFCSILQDSSISDGDEGIYGEIITGLSVIQPFSFHCNNVSISRCCRQYQTISSSHTRTHTHNTDYLDKTFTGQSSLSSSASFTNCTFTSCSASRGGALNIQSGVTANITECTFQSCSSTYGGGCISCNKGIQHFTRSTFSSTTQSLDTSFFGCVFSNNSASRNHSCGFFNNGCRYNFESLLCF